MLRVSLIAILVAMASTTLHAQSNFVRGDANSDGSQNVADAVAILELLFGGGSTVCMDANDANDDGNVDVADPVFELAFLFSSGPTPPLPFPDCGPDPTADGLDCVGPIPGCPTATPCFESADCPAGFYCEKPVGQCDVEGVCMPIPDVCPAIFDPVCGCDGNTYSNSCEAAVAGVSVAFAGECLPAGACFDNTDCPAGQFCLKAIGDCGGMGVCTDIPFICTLQFDPHCGCNGTTYSNECMAWAAGQSVMSAGPCP